jgi:hypothetical protein
VKDHCTAVLKQKGDWWIGWIEEIAGVNCQERSKEDLIETLRITLREALEFSRREALDAAGESYEEKEIALGSAESRFGISVPMDVSCCGRESDTLGGIIPA